MGLGKVWTTSEGSFWDGMWAKHRDSPMTASMLAQAVACDTVCEVGCGWGHFLQAMLDRGWRGSFSGAEMSNAGVERVRGRCASAGIGGVVLGGDFMRHVASGRLPRCDLSLCRGVVQHEAHWLPMTMAMLRIAPVALIGIGYVSDTGYHESTLRRAAGHYDVLISPSALAREAEAVGLVADIRQFRNRRRHCRELLVTVHSAT